MKKKEPIEKLLNGTIIIGIVGYLVLHIMYKIQGPSFLSSEWSPGYALSYFGTVLGTVIAIKGLYCTFCDNRKARNEQRYLEVLPVLGINVLNQDYHIPAIISDTALDIKTNIQKNTQDQDCPEYYFFQSKLETIYCIIEKGNIKYTWRLTKEQLDNVKHLGRMLVQFDEHQSGIIDTQLRFMTLEIRNYGKGPALNLQIGLNHISESESEQRFATSIQLSENEIVYFSIYSENRDISNCGEYILSMHYSDTFGRRYYQTNSFSIRQNEIGRIIYEIDCKIQQNQEK